MTVYLTSKVTQFISFALISIYRRLLSAVSNYHWKTKFVQHRNTVARIFQSVNYIIENVDINLPKESASDGVPIDPDIFAIANLDGILESDSKLEYNTNDEVISKLVYDKKGDEDSKSVYDTEDDEDSKLVYDTEDDIND